MDRYSTRLAASIIDDRRRAAEAARRLRRDPSRAEAEPAHGRDSRAALGRAFRVLLRPLGIRAAIH